MLSEYDFSTVSFARNRGHCHICGQEFRDGFVYREGEICETCKDILLAVDIQDDDWLDHIIDEEERKERDLREFYEVMGYDKAQEYIAQCQGCGTYGYAGLTCNRTEFCGEYI